MSAIATSMRTTASAISQTATSPAAWRTGITSGESPGTYEVIRARAPPGSVEAWMPTTKAAMSTSVVGMTTVPRSSCRLTSDAATAKIAA